MACVSEGEDVAFVPRLFDGNADDVGIAARLSKRLINWASTTAGKLEVIRPGTFNAQFIRSTGLKTPVLIKGDRFNENPQMGLIWPDVHGISVDILSDYIGSERKVDTWDVVKQRPGPAWTLSQWCTYWHARQDAATRMAKPQTAQPAQAGFGGLDDEDDDEGEVVDSGVVIVLQGTGSRHHNPYTAARASGISPEQAQRLLDGECLPLHGSNLTQHIHPPPAIHSVDLVRPVEREMSRMPGIPGSLDREAAAGTAARDGGEHEVRRGPVLDIKPADTLHLQMTPKDCFSDFRLAPGGAATWLYVLLGSKVVVLFPPTAKNRRLYLTWCLATRANHAKENMVVECFLADYAEGAVRVEVKASQALAIPSGWFYATAAPQDCIAVGCFFWHAYALGDTARAQQMELDLKLRPARFMLPARQLLWYAGAYYAKQLRERLGLLPALQLRRPAGTVGGARRSTSEASLNQQQRRSPYLTGLPGTAAALRSTTSMAGQQQQQGRQSGTPPMLALQQYNQQYEGSSGAVLGSPVVRGNKRARGEMDALCLGQAALPLPGAACDVAAAAAGGAPKRLKISAGGKQPGTPHAGSAGVAADAAAAAGGTPGMYGQQQQPGSFPSYSGMSTPRSVSKGIIAGLGAAPGPPAAAPSTSNHSDVRIQQLQQLLYLNSPLQQQHNGYAAAAQRARRGKDVLNIEDDDDGECHTSPVRRPEPEPLEEDPAVGMMPAFEATCGAGYQQQQQQQPRTAAAAAAAADANGIPQQRALVGVNTLKIKVPGRSVPMYSPVIQAMQGDLDSIPALTGQQLQAAVTPPPTGVSAGRQGVMSKGLPPAATGAGQGGLPAAAAATPGKLKITLKGQGTPTAAAAATAAAPTPLGRDDSAAVAALGETPMARFSGAAAAVTAATAGQEGSGGQQQQQQRRSPDSSSAGSHAVSTAQTNTSSDKQQADRQQQPVLAAAAVVVDVPPKPTMQQQQQQPMPPIQRRPSDGTPRASAAVTPIAAATAGALKPGLKLKFKMASPSPKLTALLAPQSGVGVPPALALDTPAAAAATGQPQHQQPQAVIPQVDGAGDSMHVQAACCSSPPQQQQQQQRRQRHVLSCVGEASVGLGMHEVHGLDLAAGVTKIGCASMQHVVQQGQFAMRGLLQKQQQQHEISQAGVWSQWQQLHASLQPKQQQHQQCSVFGQQRQEQRYSVLQVDGSADDTRQANAPGPTLVMQPATAAVAAAAAGGMSSHGVSSISNARGALSITQQHAVVVAPGAAAGLAPQIDSAVTDLDPPSTAAASAPQANSPVGFLSPGRMNTASRLAGAASAAGGGGSGGASTAALPAATDVLLPLHCMPHTSARPPFAKQQQQGVAMGSILAAPAAAAAPAQGDQGCLVVDTPGHAILKPNPVLQPQVQRLKLATAAAAATATAVERGNRSPDNSSPKPSPSPARMAAAVTASLDEEQQQQQQQQLGHVESSMDVLPAVPSFTCWAGQDVVEAATAAAAGQPTADNTPALQQLHGVRLTHVAPIAAAAAAAATDLATAVQQQQQPMDGNCSGKIAAAAMGWPGIASRAGSSCMVSPVASSAAAIAAFPVTSAAAAVVFRRPSGVGDSMDPVYNAATAVQQQQPAAMLPPPPTKLSAWELSEVPVLLEFLHEQYTEKADIPDHIQDPEWVLQQFHEAVSVMAAREGDGLPLGTAAVATAASNQQQQHASGVTQAAATTAGAMVQAAAEAAAAATAATITSWNSGCGPLVLTAFAPDEMPVGFAEHCKAAQALLRSSGIITATTGHEETTEVIGETGFCEQTNSAGTSSWDNRSVGSIGGSRGAAAGAGAAGVAGAGRSGGIGHNKGQVKRGASQLQTAVTAGVAQAKKANQNKVLKGIGLSAKKR